MATINTTNANIRFSVGPVGIGLYQTIQAAITAGEAAGGGTVFIHPGTYTENLVFTTGTVQMLGFNAISYIPGDVEDIIIVGVHTPPLTGNLSARNILFQSTTDIFNSAAAGSATLILEQCSVAADAGYTFNVPNWTGFIGKTLVEDSSADNGIVYNTAGATVQMQNSNSGTSATYPMTTSGSVIIKKCEIGAAWNALTGTSATVDRSIFDGSVTFSGDATGDFSFCRISSGSDASYIHSTTNDVTFTSCIFDSTHVPCIDGAGIGALRVADISFLNDNTFAALPGLTGAAGYIPGAFGTMGQVLTSNGAGIVPTFQANGVPVLPLVVGNGGTGVTTLTQYGVLVGEAAGAVQVTAAGSTGQLLVATTASNPSFANSAVGDFTFTSATAGATRLLTVSNSDNSNAASIATVKALTGGANAGDAVFQASTTTTTWSMGVDNSVTAPAADPFVIAQGTALGTNDCMRITTAGAITKPLQPSFSAYLSADVLNVTGDGTAYTIVFDAELFDLGGNFATGTGKFNAPVNGRYWLYTDIYMYSIAAAHTACELHIVADRDYQPVKINPYAMSVSGQLAINGGCFAYLTAGTEAYVSVKVSNSTKVVDLAGGANFYCFFYGYLVC